MSEGDQVALRASESVEQFPKVATPMSDASAPRRSVRLSREEAWAFVEQSHTAIVATLRSDGVPIMLPVWFVVIDRKIYVRTGISSKKAVRARRDPRASFLVEIGERWAELQAVHMVGRITELSAESEVGLDAAEKFTVKYSAFRTDRSKMSEATQSHYAEDRIYLEFEPEDRILSWDNRRLNL
jgi:nitroimidazol reductase NimA-like FMN-containing flavoprotein (pyridoxamine 5'-phosphate oxidase superfamily)